ncbi:MAG: hypothetical protein IIC36_06470, partial [Gemmatimonadetes bacterium]|nr:hypothetical protein [Gemmatimonadota bacterium]
MAVNLKWAGTNRGMTDHEGFGYVQGGSTFQVAVVSGGVGNDHTIEVIADLDLNTFLLKIDDVIQVSGVAFDNNVNIDAVRIYTNELGTGNFTTSEFDDLTIQLYTNQAPTVAAAIADTTVVESNPPINNYRDLKIVFTDLEDGSGLTFTIESNTNSGLVTPAIIAADSTLDLSFTASTSGSATITIRATDSDGLFVDDVFTVTVTATGNLNVALVCGTAACADVDFDVPLVNHLTSTLGHTVTNFAAADTGWTPSSYDVVVISESVGSSSTAWLKTEVVGILTLEGSNWDEFEMGSAGTSDLGADTQINITDNTHYITSVFPTGVLTVTTVTTNLGSMSGWANGVGKLAHYNSNSALAKLLYVDIGGVLQGGVNTAADRRAFWGAQYFANLTADGITIFNRALDWVAYNTAPNTTPTVAAAIPDLRVLKDSSPIDNYRDLKAVFTDAEDGSGLTFTIQSNTNSGLVTPTIIAADSTLDLSFTASATGTATITIRAMDSGALFVDDVFTVVVVQGFGYPTVGATRYTEQPDNKQGTKFTLSESAMADTLYFWAKLGGGAPPPLEGTGVIYEDNAGVPGAWVATAQPVAVTGTLQWYASAFSSPVPLSPGTYWLVVHHGSKIDLYGDAGTANQRAYNADTYSDGPTDPFGAAT